MNKMLIADSWLNVSYHFIIYIYINSLIATMTRAIIIRIKDRTNYQCKGKINKINSNNKKEEINITSKSQETRLW